jgi:hypothetical protein
MADTPGTNDFEYQAYIMKAMIEQLPENINHIMMSQFIKLIESLSTRDKGIKDHIISHIEDIMLVIRLQEFDLQCTKKEKLALQKRLEETQQ